MSQVRSRQLGALARRVNVAIAIRRARAAVEAYLAPDVIDEMVLRDVISARRGRPIRIAQLEQLAAEGLCGLWLETETEDVILIATGRTELHTRQFILHELAHMMLRDSSGSASGGRWSWLRYREATWSDSSALDELSAELLADHLSTALDARRRKPSRFEAVWA